MTCILHAFLFTFKFLWISSATLCHLASVNAQLALPNPPYLPPNASFGSQPLASIAASPVNLHWSSTLGSLLWFYEAQRSGDLPNTKRVSWRNDSAVFDGKDVGVDLAGGYYDAGDYIKYTFPMSFSLMSICWGAMSFGRGYDVSNQTAYLDDMLRWGLDWLVKAHSSPNTLYVQVGDENVDNVYWGGDGAIPDPRPSYGINTTHPGTDAAAQASAAFAACFALYANRTLVTASGPASLTNLSYASTLLVHAQQLYTFATNTTQQTYQDAVSSVAEAYPSSGYGDELTIAGLFLALASNSSIYYDQAVADYFRFDLSKQVTQAGDEQVFNWDSKTPGAAVLGAQINELYPVLSSASFNAVNWSRDAEAYVNIVTNNRGRGSLTNGGLLYYPGDSDSTSLNPALNAGMIVAHFINSIPSSSPNHSQYVNFVRSQLQYVFGKNPMTMPYIVGIHPNSPMNPHTAIATGASPEDIAILDTVPAQERYVLYGAVVGGPDRNDRYWDLRSDWVQSEVALDYNAPLLSLIAYALTNETMAKEDPWYTQLEVGSYQQARPNGHPCDAAIQTGCSAGGFGRVGKFAMGVIVSIVGGVVVGLALFWMVLEYRRTRNMKA